MGLVKHQCLGPRLKLWDCDTYELITSLTGHACEILAMALSQEPIFWGEKREVAENKS